MPAFEIEPPLNRPVEQLSELASGATAYRSDIAAIKAIMDSAKKTAKHDYGFAIVGGFYVYVTMPWVYLAPVIELGPLTSACFVKFDPLVEFGGPSACTGANYDDANKTCKSSLTIEDTMGDQGRPDV